MRPRIAVLATSLALALGLMGPASPAQAALSQQSDPDTATVSFGNPPKVQRRSANITSVTYVSNKAANTFTATIRFKNLAAAPSSGGFEYILNVSKGDGARAVYFRKSGRSAQPNGYCPGARITIDAPADRATIRTPLGCIPKGRAGFVVAHAVATDNWSVYDTTRVRRFAAR